MPRKTVKIMPVGNIDRRSLVTQGKSNAVLTRENMFVVGSDPESQFIRKHSGSDRYNSSTVSSYKAVSPFRYYDVLNSRKNFFFSGGKVWFIDEAGNTDEVLSLFNVNAYPVFVEAQVSSNRILYFMEGVNTGMYSYDGNLSNTFQKEVAVTLDPVDAVMWLDRMWVFEEDSESLYFSKNLEPTNFTDSTDAGVIIIGAKRGSKLQKVIVGNDDNLYIFKTDSTWVIQGRTPSEFVVREINPTMGLAARRSLQKVNNGMIGLMSDYEVYSFDGQNFKLLTYNVSLSGDFTSNLQAIINRDSMDQVNSCYHNFTYRMSFVESGAVVNDMEYCFNTINETEFFTRGAKIASYLVYDRIPDKRELVTGRSDEGRLMHMYRGSNWDNQATGATMRILTKTKYMGLGQARNFRVRKMWLNSGVRTARTIPIRTYIDGRNLYNEGISDDMATFGEANAILGMSSQDSVTSRQIPRHNNAKCQNIALEIDYQLSNLNFEFSSFEMEIISKNEKRSEKIGV